MFGIIALLLVIGIPALIAYVIALFSYKKLVKKGSSRPRRMRIIIFILSYLLLLAVEVVWFLSTVSFER